MACFAQLKQPVRHFGVSEIPNGLEAALKEQTPNGKLQMFAAKWKPVSVGPRRSHEQPAGDTRQVSAPSLLLQPSANPKLIIHPKIRDTIQVRLEHGVRCTRQVGQSLT